MSRLGLNILKDTQRTLVVIAVVLAAILSGCSNENARTGENQDSGNLTTSRGEHDRDGGKEGEEPSTQLALDETYDEVRSGVRLILAYDAQSNSFIGTVENSRSYTVKRVRVEVHLSNGVELGPTTPVDLSPGEKRNVTLTTTSTNFDGWTAHPEAGSGEHGHGEHDREGRGEHGEEHKEE